MPMNRNRALGGFLLIAIFAMGCTNPPAAANAPPAALSVKMHLKALDAQQKVIFEGTRDFSAGTSALAAMRQMTPVKTQNSSFGEFVTGINEVAADSLHYWALYADGNYSNLGIGSINLEKDTQLEWKLESIQPSG